MPGSQELKEDLKFNAELTDLLEIMKNVAVFQYRSLLKKKERFLRLSDLLEGFFDMLHAYESSNIFIHPRTEKPALIMVTSDEGFMGDLNFQVVNAALLRAGSGDAELFVVGESGERYLKDSGRKYTAFRGAANAEGRYVLAREIKVHITKGIMEERFGRATIFYPEPVSFLHQKVKALDIFPLTSFVTQGSQAGAEIHPVMESPEEDIIEYLVASVIEHKLIELFEDSKLSEFAARAVHLERSGQELVGKKDQLKQRYLHAVHELIDQNTRELFSSQIILKRKARNEEGEPGNG